MPQPIVHYEIAAKDAKKLEAFYEKFVTLAPATKLGKPELLHFVEKLRHPFQVAGDGMIVQPTATDSSQPFASRIDRPVATLDQPHLDCSNRGS